MPCSQKTQELILACLTSETWKATKQLQALFLKRLVAFISAPLAANVRTSLSCWACIKGYPFQQWIRKVRKTLCGMLEILETWKWQNTKRIKIQSTHAVSWQTKVRTQVNMQSRPACSAGWERAEWIEKSAPGSKEAQTQEMQRDKCTHQTWMLIKRKF